MSDSEYTCSILINKYHEDKQTTIQPDPVGAYDLDLE